MVGSRLAHREILILARVGCGEGLPPRLVLLGFKWHDDILAARWLFIRLKGQNVFIQFFGRGKRRREELPKGKGFGWGNILGVMGEKHFCRRLTEDFPCLVWRSERNLIGWALAVGSVVALIAGVIANLRFTFRGMSLFDLLVILILSVGGVGLFVRSLRDHSRE